MNEQKIPMNKPTKQLSIIDTMKVRIKIIDTDIANLMKERRELLNIVMKCEA